MVPPPGAGDSRDVSSAKPFTVRSISFFDLFSSSKRYSITFSRGLNSFRSSKPIDLMAICKMSSSGIPVERFCFLKKYLPASINVRFGIKPTISVPVTRMPRFCAQRQTSSKATCNGVTLMLVIFIETCAMPYSSMNQPIAFVPFSVPGIMIVFPFSSFIGLPTGEPPSRFGRPFSRTSNAIALARRVEVVFKLKFVAIKKSRAPTAVQPVRATPSSQGRAPKSGASASTVILSANSSYSPLRQIARLRRSGVLAAAS